MEEEIDLIDLLEILKRRLGIIVGLTLGGLFLSYIFTFYVQTPQYSSTAQLLVSHSQSSKVIEQSDISTNLQLIDTYKDIINGPVILDDVRAELNLNLTHEELANKIHVSSESSSQVFAIQVIDESAYGAAEIANTTAEIFRDNIDEIMNVDNVTIISKAIESVDPISPNRVLNLSIGLLLGTMSGIGLAFVWEFLDDTVKDEKFITQEIGWINLGSIVEMTEGELKLEEPIPQRQG